jgi:hypothetical protein
MGYRHWKWAGGVVISTVLFVGCGSDATINDDDEGGGTGGGGAGVPQLVGVDGVIIKKVSIYQGVERPLAIDGVQQPSEVPLVPGRAALLRVFYEAPGATGKAVTGRLELGDGTIVDAPTELAPSTIDGELGTSVNFFLEGAQVFEPFSYRVTIGEAGNTETATGVPHHPPVGLETHNVAGPVNKLRVVLVPFRYDADGSGRLPNLSPEHLEYIKNRFLQLYPVSDVELTVRDAVPWSQTISPNGGGWQEVGIQLYQIRQAEAPSPDYYYYGIFNPTTSFGTFCGGGCLLGVTLLNNDPPDLGNEQLRLALGVGFDEVAAGTAAHEVGHSHGREHANCGQGLDPQSIDPSYPHAGGLIGTWGYDILSQTLRDPAVYSDIMGYCQAQWISDYNFTRLHARGSLINQPDLAGVEPTPRVVLSLDGEGRITTQATVPMRPLFGPRLPVTVKTDAGETTLEGHWFAYDHLPGGWLIVSEDDAASL